jgi:hypothetical protein
MPQTNKTANIKIPQIARWSIAGITDRRIADMLGMTTGGLAQLLATPEYQDYEAALMNGHLSAMDRALAGKVEAIHQECRNAVPAALRCLVDVVTQRRDLKAAMAAAKEILDRDPDRTLPDQASGEPVAPGIPAAVIDAACNDAAKIVQGYAEDVKKVVN